jgi:integrase
MFSAVKAIAPSQEVSLATALDAYLASAQLAPTSLRVYREALHRLVRELGERTPAGAVDAEHLEHGALRAWGELGPSTWNRNVGALRSFLRFTRPDAEQLLHELGRHLHSRREPADRTRAIPYIELERLWRRESVPLREKALWRLLYESAGRASEILGLDAEDLDLANKRARIRSKGGDLELVHFASGATRALARLLGDRRRGPVFLAMRGAAALGTPGLDICPVTGRARLSYRRAAALFTQHSGGYTLHQLRHSRLTHLAEAGVSTVMLMGVSRHHSLRSLQRYARPGPESIAQLMAELDPGRRRA